jgi:hypothetical protein
MYIYVSLRQKAEQNAIDLYCLLHNMYVSVIILLCTLLQLQSATCFCEPQSKCLILFFYMTQMPNICHLKTRFKLVQDLRNKFQVEENLFLKIYCLISIGIITLMSMVTANKQKIGQNGHLSKQWAHYGLVIREMNIYDCFSSTVYVKFCSVKI